MSIMAFASLFDLCDLFLDDMKVGLISCKDVQGYTISQSTHMQSVPLAGTPAEVGLEIATFHGP